MFVVNTKYLKPISFKDLERERIQIDDTLPLILIYTNRASYRSPNSSKTCVMLKNS